MNKKVVYEKIEDVLRESRRSLAEHEFKDIHLCMPVDHIEGGRIVDGRYYVGCSESSLGRRLRAMREIGRVTSKRREGAAFMEYTLAHRKPIQQELALEIR